MTTNFHTAIPYQAEATSAMFNDRLSDLDDALSGVVPITGMDINGGTIDNTPIGATTASTGRFTDLTVTGSTTGVNVGAGNVTSGTFDNARINWASPSAIGATTANTLRGTTLALTSTNNVGSSLNPTSDNTLDLGSVTNRWNDVYAGVGRFNQITQPVDVITTITGSYERNILSSTYTPSADSAAFIASTRFNTTISNAFNHTTNGVNGVYSTLTHNGVGTTGTARNLYAISTFSAGTVSGFGIAVNNVASGSTMSSNRGLYVLMTTSSGTITNQYGVFIDNSISGSPVITGSQGLRVANFGGTGVTTAHGILVSAQTGATTNYAIQTDGGIVDFMVSNAFLRARSVGNANMLYVDGTNNRVGIGTSSPTRTFEVNGTIGSATTYSTTVGGTNRALYVDSTGLIGYVVSREGAKNSIVALRDDVGLFEKLISLNPISFYYNGDMSGQRRYGLSANHVDTINPHWVSYDEVFTTDEETGEQIPTGELIPATVNYTELIAPIIDAIQRIHERLSILEGA